MRGNILSFVFLLLLGVKCEVSGEITPVVLWHGMGDSCCFSFSMGAITKLIEEEIPGIYVRSIKIGNNEIEDVEKGYFGNINKQIADVCKELSADDRLSSGFNAIGFSQGGQFLRGIVERCSTVNVKNLISIGGQHQGVYGLPNCGSLEHRLCDYLRQMLQYAAYHKFVQERLIQASYWHDPLKEQEYKENSIFLADINNEISINQTYKSNLLKLSKLVLVKFTKDTMVTPPESEWFGFYKANQSRTVIPMSETDLYKEDRIGLKTLDENQKIDLFEIDGNHLQFTAEWFVGNIVEKFLR